MIRLVCVALAALAVLFVSAPGYAAERAASARVRLETTAGPIVIEVDLKRAPITAGNFLRYAEEKRFDGTTFYRAARNKKDGRFGLVQGGINHKVVRARVPIAHEPTDRTGLRHLDGTVSMARNAPGTAMGDFFVTVGTARYLDARPGYAGYAAFGRVVQGMDVIRKILAAPTYPGGRSHNTMGQHIVKPVRIVSARRVRG
ncbi:peptidylprolyl isomerase [Sphingosinicella sp. LY1275]|uniref:peptidylprolyl isomerase n=1 Tax=Sphingosinicella sp. LY1275 TaxID=3095379 RepID=UPI002ADEB4C1|nr:peptidylprolyl isomerase [Sphingosinicella sp. LY1275]MEA1015888.1 peptidylprolyl isomerase [Sphingosinicella sp. LY1275]